MRKNIKCALIFTGGVAVGIGVCGASLISYALSDEDIRDGIKTKISKKVDKALYGDRSYRNPYYPYSKVSYKNYYDTYKKDDDSYNFDSSSILFASRKDAEEVKEKMEDIIYKYGYVTVADIRDIAELKSSYIDSKYGWLSLKDAKIVITRKGCYISLPNPVPVD